MQNITPKDQYNIYTLKLSDPKLYGPFYEFIIDEIQFLMPYYMIFCVGMIINAITYVEENFYILLYVILALSLLAIYLSRNRCRKYVVINFLLFWLVWCTCEVFVHVKASYKDQ